MHKLVLGIIGVVLLQVAFLVHVASDLQGTAVGVHPANGSVRARSEEAGQSTDLERSSTVILTQADQKAGSASAPGVYPQRPGRVRKAPDGRTAVAHRTLNRASREHVSTDRSVATSVRTSEPAPARATVVNPKGYTMVLVDHTPRSGERGKKEAVMQHRERKRLPAVIRKPWNWIKSVASKLY